MKYMTKSSLAAKKEVLKKIKKRAQTLLTERNAKQKTKGSAASVIVKIQKSQSRSKKIDSQTDNKVSSGVFLIKLDVTAIKEMVYVPLSISSSKKPTGFMYYIEGTGPSDIYRAGVTSRGDGITRITLGTITYIKIPAKKTASFRLMIETRGRIGKTYKIIVSRINYKSAPQDSRYIRLDKQISTKSVKFL